MNLSLTSLEDAISQLEKSLGYYHSDVVQADPGLVLQLRAAAIQAFEFTYELSWKMLKRYLKTSEPNPASIENMSFPELIRLGCDKGLLMSELKEWNRYRQKRGTTSHTYDQAKAEEVFKQIPAFLKDAQFLLEQLHARVGE